MSLEIHLYSVTILSRVPGAHQFLCFATAQSNISNASYFHSNWTTHTVQNTKTCPGSWPQDIFQMSICFWKGSLPHTQSQRARHPGIQSQVGLRKHHYKVSGGDRIPVELFQILKDDAVKVLHSICQQIWKTQQWPQYCKRSVFIPVPKKGNA